MKKIFTFIFLIFTLFGCGEDKSLSPEPKEIIPYSFYQNSESSVKLGGIVNVNLVNDKFPSITEMEMVANDIIGKNPKFENYFFRFEIPFNIARPSKTPQKFDLYYNINKLGKNDFEIMPLYQQLQFYDLTIKKEYIGKLGFNKISNISPLKIGMSIEELIDKLGSPSEKTKDTYSYFILNDRCQTFGTLYLSIKDDKVEEISFSSYNINFTEEQISDIKEYIKGNKELSSLKIKELDDIYPFSVKGEDFKYRLNYSLFSLAEPKPDYVIESIDEDYYAKIPSKNSNYVKYFFNPYSKDFEVTKISIFSKTTTEEEYDTFLTDLMQALIFLDPETDFFFRNEVLKKLNFLYDQFISKKPYKNTVISGKYKYSVNKTKNKVYLTIRENK